MGQNIYRIASRECARARSRPKTANASLSTRLIRNLPKHAFDPRCRARRGEASSNLQSQSQILTKRRSLITLTEKTTATQFGNDERDKIL